MSASISRKISSSTSSSSISSYFDIYKTPTPINYLSINKKFTFDNINPISPSSSESKKSKLSQSSQTSQLSPTPFHTSHFLKETPKSKVKSGTDIRFKSKSTSDLGINTDKLDSLKVKEEKHSANNELLKRRGLSQIPKINVY